MIDTRITSDTLTGAANYDIYFSDNNTGLCSTSLGIYITTDCGVSWNNVSALPPTNPSALTMYDNSHAWAVYDNKIIHANGDLDT